MARLRKCDKACARSVKAALRDAKEMRKCGGLPARIGHLRETAALSGCRHVPTCRVLRA